MLHTMTQKNCVRIAVVILLLWAPASHAATITAASCSQTDVQNAVNSTASGDTVRTPGPCTSSWGSRVSLPSSKGITVDGGGNTTLTMYGFTINQNSSASTRVTGFTFTNGVPAANDYAIVVNGSPSSAAGRIDHNSFPATTSNNTFINISGNGPFLIDHNTFSSSGAPNEMIHNVGMGSSDASGWADNVVPGSAAMVFIEDNTFTYNPSGSPAYYYGSSAVQSYYGARTVFRHNTLNMMQIDFHGTAGMIGARWAEVYENTFNTGVPNASQSNYIVIRGGSGVIFNNHHTGVNCGDNSCGNISLYEEDPPPYPATYQPGRGLNQAYSPIYIWGNDSTMPAGGDGNLVLPNRDFFVSSTQPSSMIRCEAAADGGSSGGTTCPTTFSYTPYTYPHPLQGTGTAPSAPSAPTNLTIR
jgi:hypothetical protein